MLEARIVEAWPLDGVGAGSGLVAAGGWLVAIQDDAPIAARIDVATRAVVPLPLVPGAARLPKAAKPDLEAIAADADGALWLFGSGGAPARRRIARLFPATGACAWQDAGPLYDAIAAAIGEAPNVEGAAIAAGAVRLFHRGAGRGTCRNWVVTAGFGPDGPALPLRGAVALALGDVGGVPFSVTDAAALPDGRTLYLAAAEDTPDAIADGPVVGAALGVLDASYAARWAVIRDPDGVPTTRKLEGLAPDPDLRHAWAVTDPDDADRPAELCRLALSGFEETR